MKIQNVTLAVLTFVMTIGCQHQNADDYFFAIEAEVVQTKSSAKRTKFIEENIKKIRERCHAKNEIVTIAGNRVLCITGEISPNNTLLPATGNKRNYGFAYIYSGGGDIDTAMKIGKEMKENHVYLIVERHCYSACGAYIVPAAQRIYMTDNTVISMHGSLDRTKNKYVQKIFKARGINPVSTPGFAKKALAQRKNYEVYERENVIPEVKYFSFIDTDEAFVKRFDEVVRTFKRRKNYLCKPEKGLKLIVGPEYLDEFNIKAIRTWFPKDKKEYVKLLNATDRDFSLVFDFDEHPFFVSGKGIVSPEDCYG